MNDDIAVSHAFDMKSPSLKRDNIFACIDFNGVFTVFDNAPIAFKNDFTVAVHFHVNAAEICRKCGQVFIFFHTHKSPSCPIIMLYIVNYDEMR